MFDFLSADRMYWPELALNAQSNETVLDFDQLAVRLEPLGGCLLGLS